MLASCNMYLRKYCVLSRHKVIRLSGVKLLGGSYLVQLNKNICLHCGNSRYEQSVFYSILKKSEVLICSKLQLHNTQGLQDRSGDEEKGKSKKSNEEGEKKTTSPQTNNTITIKPTNEEGNKKQTSPLTDNKTVPKPTNEEGNKKQTSPQTENKTIPKPTNVEVNKKQTSSQMDNKTTRKPVEGKKQTSPPKNNKTTPFGWPIIKKPHKKYFSKRNIKIAAVLFGIASIYYFAHLEEDPISKRKKFHSISVQRTHEIGQTQSDHYKKKYENYIETSGENFDRVSNIVNTLVKANSDLPGVSGKRNWAIFVIKNDSKIGSYVMANGHVFVYSGLLRVVEGDDQLAAFLAHQLAHVLLNHYAEAPTWKLKLLTLFSPFSKTVSNYSLKQHLGEKLELEADRLSIEMMAKACFNPRKVREFWGAMDNMRKNNQSVGLIMSKHPMKKSRYRQFDSLMPYAFNTLHKHCDDGLHPFLR